MAGQSTRDPWAQFADAPGSTIAAPAPRAPQPDYGSSDTDGIVAPGNIDLSARKPVRNPDGSISTELSFSIGTDKGEVLLPRVVNGKMLSQQQAIDWYKRTGENLGTFRGPADADRYAQSLHERQAVAYGGGNNSDPFEQFADANQPETAQPISDPRSGPPTPDIGRGSATLGGWKSGALLGFDDEISGVGAAGGNWLVNNVLTSDVGQKLAPYIAALIGKGYDPNWRFNPTGQTDAQAYEAERQKAEAYKNEAWQQHPGFYMAGFAPGTIASAIAAPEAKVASGETALGRGANMMANGAIFGGVSGAGNAQPGERLTGGATGAAIGAAAGPVANYLARGVANVISPNVAPVVSRLQAEGIPLTPGQIAGASGGVIGKGIRGVEEMGTSIPGLGAVINGARTRGVEAFNRAGINKALEPIGESLPKEVPIGPVGVKFAGNKLSQAYEDVLPKLAAKADDQFMSDLAGVADRVDTMVGPRAEQFGKIMDSDVRRFFNDDGTIAGRGLKEIETRLGGRIRTMMSSMDADQRDMGIALRSVQEAIRDLAARQNPSQAATLRSINDGWAALTRVEAAGAKGTDSGFSPGNFRQAVKEGDKTVRKRGFARGDALMQQFADDAYNVLPNKTPDSGTAGRGLLGMMLTGQLVLGPKGVAGAAAAAAPYTKTGGKFAEWLMTGRQGPAAKSVADAFRKFAGGGSGGAKAGPDAAAAKGPGIGGEAPASGYPRMDPDGQTVWLSDSIGIPVESFRGLPEK